MAAFDVTGIIRDGVAMNRVCHKVTGMTIDCKPGDDPKHAMQFDALTGG
jgi:hypothetical protein